MRVFSLVSIDSVRQQNYRLLFQLIKRKMSSEIRKSQPTRVRKIFPSWEANVPRLGTKHSQPGNNTEEKLFVRLKPNQLYAIHFNISY